MADNQKIIDAARERMTLCVDSENTNRADAVDDLKFLKGDQWPADAKKQRELEGRPCLTINKLPAFLRQITNDQRQNTPAIKVHPVDDGADIETAKVVQGMIRHIEYDSNADSAYDTAVNSAAACGIGWFRLVTEYDSETSFDQVIRFKRIRNAMSVYRDPYSQEPDGSDMRFCFITDLMNKDEFKRQHPKAQITSGIQEYGMGDSYKNWLQDDGVVIAEYYWIDDVDDTLVMLSDGSTGFKSQLDDAAIEAAGIEVVAERPSARRIVRWAKITGMDVLEDAEIPCRWIPVFPVYGEELDIEGEVTLKGVVRNAKDPARMYNYWMTSATEEVSLRPKTPFIGAEGQFDADSAKWKTANVKSFPYIQYKPVTLNGQIAPPPQRSHMADVPTGVLSMAAHANEDIKATTGIFDASMGASGNETSGRAILARQREGDLSNFHYSDNLVRTIRHTGRCIMDMLPRVYDTERVVRILGEDELVGHEKINAPMEQPEQDPKTGAIKSVLNDISVGKYDITVTAGPSYTTKRQEAAEAMTQFAQSWPQLMQLAGDKVVKAMDWPGADEIAERIARTIPPEIRGEEEGEMPIPPEVQQQMAQMEQVMQQMQGELEEAKSGLAKSKIDADSRVRVAEINAQGRIDTEEIRGMVKILVEQMMPPQPLAAAAYQTGSPPDQPQPPQPGAYAQTNNPPSAGFLMPEQAPIRSMPDQAPGMGIAPVDELAPPVDDAGQGNSL
ncbi:hypothetical protein H0A71_06550 [Alcaligenaceae bacterium]|nr:hypothetical protein [Alcaligenaceae bacterium]